MWAGMRFGCELAGVSTASTFEPALKRAAGDRTSSPGGFRIWPYIKGLLPVGLLYYSAFEGYCTVPLKGTIIVAQRFFLDFK